MGQCSNRSRYARKAGLFQNARNLIQMHASVDLRMDERILNDLETAKLLFATGEESQAIISLKSLESVCEGNVKQLPNEIHARVSILLADYISLTRSENPQRILENFRRPSINKAGTSKSTAGLFACAQYKLAIFADSKYKVLSRCCLI
jgi:hypothetical protein